MSHLILDLFLVVDIVLPSEGVNTRLQSGIFRLTALSCYERTEICTERERECPRFHVLKRKEVHERRSVHNIDPGNL